MAESKKKINPELEKIKVKFPTVRGKKNQDSVVMVNGKEWQIQRGKTVEVPKYVLDAYDNNQMNLEAADKYILENASE